jgi:hypothetical protein
MYTLPLSLKSRIEKVVVVYYVNELTITIYVKASLYVKRHK